MRAVLGGGRGEINFSDFFASHSFHSPLLFHDSAPEECRLPWKPFLGPLVGGMSGLLSLERLWQGQSRECFEDGLHFCRIFSGQFLLSLLCEAVQDQLAVSPRSQRDHLHLAQKYLGCFWHWPASSPNKRKSSDGTAKCCIACPSD